jgi:hypothetical protein
MKTKQTTCKLIVGVFLAVGISLANAAPVVFNVNMSVQSAIGTFNPANGDTVALMGIGNDWDVGIGMVQSANPDVYTITNDLAAGSWPNYKFIIKPATGNWIWESPASTGGQNRWFQVPATGTNLPVVFFSDNTTLPTETVSITFQLNMHYAILNGQFNPDAMEYVSVFGSWDSWGQTGVLLTNVPGTSNYVGTLTSTTLATNNVVTYKFAKNGYGGTWENVDDRTVTITNTTMLLPFVYWNDVSTLLGSYPVRFTVDMTTQDALGTFTPGLNTVFVNGDWDWSGQAFQLMQAGSSAVYTGTVALAFAPATTVNYKYAIDGGFSWENDGLGPNGAQNRQFVMSGATNLPAEFYNNQKDLGPLVITRVGNETALQWDSGTNINNRIRLEKSSALAGGWTEITEAQGQSGITNDFGTAPVFFRLIGP